MPNAQWRLLLMATIVWSAPLLAIERAHGEVDGCAPAWALYHLECVGGCPDDVARFFKETGVVVGQMYKVNWFPDTGVCECEVDKVPGIEEADGVRRLRGAIDLEAEYDLTDAGKICVVFSVGKFCRDGVEDYVCDAAATFPHNPANPDGVTIEQMTCDCDDPPKLIFIDNNNAPYDGDRVLMASNIKTSVGLNARYSYEGDEQSDDDLFRFELTGTFETPAGETCNDFGVRLSLYPSLEYYYQMVPDNAAEPTKWRSAQFIRLVAESIDDLEEPPHTPDDQFAGKPVNATVLVKMAHILEARLVTVNAAGKIEDTDIQTVQRQVCDFEFIQPEIDANADNKYSVYLKIIPMQYDCPASSNDNASMVTDPWLIKDNADAVWLPAAISFIWMYRSPVPVKNLLRVYGTTSAGGTIDIAVTLSDGTIVDPDEFGVPAGKNSMAIAQMLADAINTEAGSQLAFAFKTRLFKPPPDGWSSLAHVVVDRERNVTFEVGGTLNAPPPNALGAGVYDATADIDFCDPAAAPGKRWVGCSGQMDDVVSLVANFGEPQMLNVFVVQNLSCIPAGVAFAYRPDGSDLGTSCFIQVPIGSAASTWPYVIAHEIGHLLLDAEDVSTSCDLMNNSAGPQTASVAAFKRLGHERCQWVRNLANPNQNLLQP